MPQHPGAAQAEQGLVNDLTSVLGGAQAGEVGGGGGAGAVPPVQEIQPGVYKLDERLIPIMDQIAQSLPQVQTGAELVAQLISGMIEMHLKLGEEQAAGQQQIDGQFREGPQVGKSTLTNLEIPDNPRTSAIGLRP